MAIVDLQKKSCKCDHPITGDRYLIAQFNWEPSYVYWTNSKLDFKRAKPKTGRNGQCHWAH